VPGKLVLAYNKSKQKQNIDKFLFSFYFLSFTVEINSDK